MKPSLMTHLVRSRPRWTDDERLGAAVTALLLADPDSDADYELRRTIFDGLRAGRYRIDTRLIIDLYAICPPSLRKLLVGSSPFGYLDQRAFEPRFLETYRSPGLTARERLTLTEPLQTYLWRHPERLTRFAGLILDLLRSSGWDRVRGLHMASRLSRLGEHDRALVQRSLRDRSPYVRMNAHNLLFWWVKRKSELSPDLRAFLMSPEVRAIAFDRYQRDPNVDVQTCAYYFLKAREPRAGHKPPKGMAVPPPHRKRRKRHVP